MTQVKQGPRNENYCTPLVWVERVRAALGGVIDLDPCGNESDVVGAVRSYRWPREDGLELPWAGRVFVNPPYGKKKVSAFLRRSLLASQEGVASVVVLLPVSVDTLWWHELVWGKAKLVAFIKGRIAFYLDGVIQKSPANGTAFVLYSGDREVCRTFRDVFERVGRVIEA
jgi:hypothetical protein